MSCYGCSRKYGLFCKEYGCPNCGYSYCAKCLKRPIAVPRHANKVLNVCLICYDKLSKMQANADADKVIDCDALPGDLVTKLRLPSKHTTSPDAAAEKADALFDSVLPTEELGAVLSPISSDVAVAAGSSTDSQEIDENLDKAIKKRLQNLKADDTPTTTNDDEIRERLSNLSGMPHQKNYDKKDLLLSTDQRTEEDKIKDLLHQFLGESELDQRVDNDRNDAISDIERRLRALRDAPIDNVGGAASMRVGASTADTDATNTPSDNEEENDEVVLQNVMKKYLAESRLPTAADPLEAELGTTSNSSASNTEELPWCNICDEDAVFRCLGCDGDLYCAQCYRECHDDEEYRAHVKEKYSAPPNFKENHF